MIHRAAARLVKAVETRQLASPENVAPLNKTDDYSLVLPAALALAHLALAAAEIAALPAADSFLLPFRSGLADPFAPLSFAHLALAAAAMAARPAALILRFFFRVPVTLDGIGISPPRIEFSSLSSD